MPARSLAPDPPSDQVKRGVPATRALAGRRGSPSVPRPAGGSSPSCVARLPCRWRTVRPPSGRRWTRESQGAAGRPSRPTVGAGRSPASGLGDSAVPLPQPPPPTQLRAELAAGRPPRSRPASPGPAGPQISAH